MTPSLTERPRRWPRIVAIVGVVLVLLSGAVSFAWLSNYHPLTQGSFLFSTLRPDVRQTSIDAFDLSGTVFDVPAGRTATFRYRLSIRNDGPIGVTIEDIGWTDRGDASRLSRRAVRVDPSPYQGSPEALERWHPFSLAPGEEAIVEMEAAYRGTCLERGSSLSWYWEPVTFIVLGSTRHENVQAGVEVRFVGTGDC